MDPIAIAALVLSVISILLWVYTFMFQKGLPSLKIPAQREEQKTVAEEKNLPDIRKDSGLSLTPEYLQHESNFMNETQKFSHMVRKNLEMLNTRVGIKFDVKPISEKYSQKNRGPNYVDSMETSDEHTDNSNMITDESQGNEQ